ncbi:TPA: toxin-antitoxin system HicB family antitoxin [Clostridioides difficile]|nr:toxin-antitoxin system HicB family antitoxin [Clostridioides difficile]MDK3209798.1 toxin-antitoxin system HicB family antitoxin [Clostridioides difficile]CZR83052.1 HicB family protein [Clostridioides difficile]CZR83198.1 HicB family protein [Clostridioides difficile]
MKNKKSSGRITLRTTPSLHRKLLESAKRENLSLNQYCSYVLAEEGIQNNLNSKSLDRILENIRSEVGEFNLEKLINELKPVYEKIEHLKEVLKVDIKTGNIKITMPCKVMLEKQYPATIIGNNKRLDVCMKIPTVKIVIEPQNKKSYTTEFEGTLEKYKKQGLIFFRYVNTDELNGENIFFPEYVSMRSMAIYIINKNLDDVYNDAVKIGKELEKLKTKGDFKIKYTPISRHDLIEF